MLWIAQLDLFQKEMQERWPRLQDSAQVYIQP